MLGLGRFWRRQWFKRPSTGSIVLLDELEDYRRRGDALCARNRFDEFMELYADRCNAARSDGQYRMVEAIQSKSVHLMLKYHQNERAFDICCELQEHEFLLRRKTCLQVFHVLELNQLPEQIISLYDTLEESQMDHRAEAIVMRALNHIGYHAHALAMFARQADPKQRTSYRAAIDACLALSDFDQLERLFVEMDKRGLPIPTKEYTGSIQAALAQKQYPFAEKWIQSMVSANLPHGRDFAQMLEREKQEAHTSSN